MLLKKVSTFNTLYKKAQCSAVWKIKNNSELSNSAKKCLKNKTSVNSVQNKMKIRTINI